MFAYKEGNILISLQNIRSVCFIFKWKRTILYETEKL